MVKSMNVADAKRYFSDLLGRVAYKHETITITRRGKPMAKLVPVGPDDEQRHMADAKGWLDDDDEFFTAITTVVADRQTHRPRVAKRSGRRS